MKAIRDQLAFLRDRAAAISSGIQKIDGSLRQRGKMYASAARSVFWQTRGKANSAIGRDEVRRLLSGSEHCEDCIRYADMGWQPNDGETLPPPGVGSRCNSNCRCEMQFRSSSAA